MERAREIRVRTKGELLGRLWWLLCLLLLSGCAAATGPPGEAALFVPAAERTIGADSHLPVFLVRGADKSFNRIGMPSVRELPDQSREIIVDPERPAIFFEKSEFGTERGRYTNLIYRIHFEEVPFGLTSFNLTAGTNPGLLVIYTVDMDGTLLLVTTVHTCGCYLAFFPTKALAPTALPENWPAGSQWVYGYKLPARLPPVEQHGREQVKFTLAGETHRVSEVAVAGLQAPGGSVRLVTMPVLPMERLYALPFKGTTESFFETDGPRRGYVKNNTKIIERLLLSWWVFDLRIGEDKAFGGGDESDVRLYTSLKFWARDESDLKDFPRFLAYWGWRL